MRGLMMLVVGLGMGGLLTNHPVYWMLFGFFLLVTIGSRRTSPHVLRAAKALDIGLKSKGFAKIVINKSGDTPSFHATIDVAANSKWRFEFIPTGWQPREGEAPVEVFGYPGVEWPALIRSEQGIFYPRDDPERVSA